jgi:threonine dehydrogenase-like Zn-dependent dehydrogenase
MQLLLVVFSAALPLLTGFRLTGLPARTRVRTATQMALPAEQKKEKRVVIVGATGYIGKFVVKESIRRGYETVAVMRDSSAPKDDFFKGCEVVYGDVTDEENLRAKVFNKKADVVISCLASRSGTKVNVAAACPHTLTSTRSRSTFFAVGLLQDRLPGHAQHAQRRASHQRRPVHPPQRLLRPQGR